jgi:hypothetical protein
MDACAVPTGGVSRILIFKIIYPFHFLTFAKKKLDMHTTDWKVSAQEWKKRQLPKRIKPKLLESA